MKLATLADGSRDGRLAIVSRDGQRYVEAAPSVPTLQAALDDWERAEPALREVAGQLEAGTLPGSAVEGVRLMAPLPRAYEWIDGSAFINHIELVRKARGAEVPESIRTDPLVYQGGSGILLGPNDPIILPDAKWGLDLEAEVCVILGDTPRGVRATRAASYVRLLTLANDITYRDMVPRELAKGFGFFQSKPATAFSPFAVTPDELGTSWRDGRVHLRLQSRVNEELLGDPEAGEEMHFSFFDLIEHITKTRAFTAGTILGGGTVSNQLNDRGASCIVERRTREMLEHGASTTPYLRRGDRVHIEMFDRSGSSVFGAIQQGVRSS